MNDDATRLALDFVNERKTLTEALTEALAIGWDEGLVAVWSSDPEDYDVDIPPANPYRGDSDG